jgi:predicted membrane protein
MFLMSLIPTEALLWAIHGIVLFGIVVFISSYFAGPYKILVTPFALVIILFGVFYEGNYYGTKDYRDKVAEIETKVEEVKVESEKVNTVIQTKYVDKIKIVKEKAEENVKIIEKIVTQYDNKCELSNAAIVLHDSASQNTISPSTGSVVEGTSKVKISDVLRTVTDNYATYYQTREQVIGWQQWYKEQKKLYEDKLK